MCDERRIIRRMNREESWNYQHDNRDAQQRAHCDLQAPEPTDAHNVHDIKKDETADGQGLMRELSTDAVAAEFDNVISQRARQISAGADISDNLQPGADVGDFVPAKRSR